LALRPTSSYSYALITIGANDTGAVPAEAQWNSDLAYVLDAIHTWRPDIRVGVALPWVRGRLAECNTLAGRIATVVGARAWAFIGPDERVYLEGGDDGVTYTTDGTHPNAAGYTLAAQLWLTAMGY
jgi:lysophospholipase L1-like esterase